MRAEWRGGETQIEWRSPTGSEVGGRVKLRGRRWFECPCSGWSVRLVDARCCHVSVGLLVARRGGAGCGGQGGLKAEGFAGKGELIGGGRANARTGHKPRDITLKPRFISSSPTSHPLHSQTLPLPSPATMPGHDPALILEPVPSWFVCSICDFVGQSPSHRCVVKPRSPGAEAGVPDLEADGPGTDRS